MTTTEASPHIIFDDARRMHSAALARMADDDIRDAAEKAWCATLRATEALVLARTGQPSPRSPDVTRALRTIARRPVSAQLAVPVLRATSGPARRLLLHRLVRAYRGHPTPHPRDR